MNRRQFAATVAGAVCASAQSSPIPIIDTHIHLYDPTRPQGIPWPPKDSPIYTKTLPSRLREVTKGMGVVGAIEVECSPWVEDNQWVLDVSANEEIIVGMIGNLEPDKPEFRKQLERFSKNPLYRGIRYGYLWDRDPGKALERPAFIAGLKDLAAAGLSLDTANPSVKLLEDMLKISDRVPDLRIILDHLPALYPPAENAERARFDKALKELQPRRQVYAKLSAVLRTQEGKKVSYGLAAHKDRLDRLYDTFGPDRVVFGSDWPNSDLSNPYRDGLTVMQEYFSGKGREATEKYFWRNSVNAYRWVRRNSQQPDPTRRA